MKAALCEYPLFFQQSTSIFPANQALIDALRLKHHPKKDLLTPELPETIFKTIQLKQLRSRHTKCNTKCEAWSASSSRT